MNVLQRFRRIAMMLMALTPLSGLALAIDPPTNLTASDLRPNSATLSFTDNVNPPGTVYRFTFSLPNDFSDPFRIEGGTALTPTPYFLTRLTPDSNHRIAVVAVSPTGEVSAPAFTDVKTSKVPFPLYGFVTGDETTTTFPAIASRDLSNGTNFSDGVQLSGATAYEFGYTASSADQPDPAGFLQTVNTGSADGNHLYTFTNVVPAGSNYFFHVRITNTYGTNNVEGLYQRLLYAPYSLTGFSDRPTSVTLDFKAGSNPANTTYVIYFRVGNSGAFTPLTSVTTKTPVLNNLIPSTTYEFYVVTQASDGSNNFSSESNHVTITTLAPQAPTGLTVTGKTDTTLTAQWNASLDATGYTVRASLDAAGTQTPTTVDSAATNAVIPGLTPNTNYFVAVRTNIGSVSSPYSTPVESRTLAAIPGLAGGAVTGTTAVLTLTANGNPNQTAWVLERATTGSGGALVYTVVANGTFDGSPSVNHTDTGLTPNSGYVYRAYAINGDGIPTDYSTVVTINTLELSAPASASITDITNTSVTVTFDSVIGATDYLVTVLQNGTPVATNTGATAPITVAGLLPNTPYTVQVQSQAGGNQSPPTSAGNFVTLASLPTNPTVTNPTATSLTVNWNANGNPPNTVYEVQIRRTGSADPFVDATPTGGTTSLSFVAPNLLPGTSYDFQIRAINSNGVPTAYVGPVSGTTNNLGTPATVTITNVDETSLAISLVPVVGATEYRAFASVNASGTPEAAANTFTGANGVITGLTPNTEYFAFAQACNGGNCSAPVAADNNPAVTLANPPANPQVANVTAASADFSWTANGNPAGTIYIAEISNDSTPFTAYPPTTNLTQALTGLTANVTYTVRVKAVNSQGISSAYVTTTFNTAVVEAPTNASIIDVTNNSLTVAFTATPGAVDYIVTVRQNGAVVASNTGTASPILVNGLQPNTPYTAEVQSRGNGGNTSAPVNAGSATTLANPPINLQISNVTSQSANLNWEANGNPNGTRYVAEISLDGVNFVPQSPTTNLATLFSGLSSDTDYVVRVKALNELGVSTTYTTGSFRTAVQSVPGSFTINNVTDRSAQAGFGSTPGAVEYQVVVSESNSIPPTASPLTYTGPASPIALNNLQPNTRYFATIRSRDSAGNFSSYSSPIEFVTAAAIPELTGTLAGTTIDLSWITNGNPPNTTYVLEQSVNGAAFTQIASQIGTFYPATGLTAGQTYSYRVYAVNQQGSNSGFSNVVTFTLAAAAPVATIPSDRTTNRVLTPNGDGINDVFYKLDAPGKDARIFDTNASLVAVMTPGTVEGSYEWDGKDREGNKVPAGPYIWQIGERNGIIVVVK